LPDLIERIKKPELVERCGIKLTRLAYFGFGFAVCQEDAPSIQIVMRECTRRRRNVMAVIEC
jgi:hypothetical protein